MPSEDDSTSVAADRWLLHHGRASCAERMQEPRRRYSYGAMSPMLRCHRPAMLLLLLAAILPGRGSVALRGGP